MRKPRSVVGIWRDAKEVLTKQASLGNEPQESCRNSRSGKFPRRPWVDGTLRTFGKPNGTEQNEVKRGIGDDETPWPGQKSKRVVYRYYRTASGNGSAPSPRRNDSERPLTQAATRRDATRRDATAHMPRK
ncbi:hypothetical protein ALC56_08179 [Trachymyrmex septentrionalis]|uniref:Uncharacterized protein n=1 Tax=Trachymyrmex septentrionalis TaxID=34720 RepID=A0A151JVG8_9HYME|nr:hypothetical protein ALC56_08179 [Trachymyrmex septentrionalis]